MPNRSGDHSTIDAMGLQRSLTRSGQRGDLVIEVLIGVE